MEDGVRGSVEELFRELGVGAAGEGAAEGRLNLDIAMEGEEAPRRKGGETADEETEGHCERRC